MPRKFAIRVESKLLRNLRKIAREQGRSLQTLVEEALVELIRQRGRKPRASVITAYLSSIDRFGPLYKELTE
jgi:hypothetical protein